MVKGWAVGVAVAVGVFVAVAVAVSVAVLVVVEVGVSVAIRGMLFCAETVQAESMAMENKLNNMPVMRLVMLSRIPKKGRIA